MKYEITKLIFQGCSIYSLNNIVNIAFTKNNKINLKLSKPVKSTELIENEIDINDIEKYINADINIIGLICSCYLIDTTK